MASRSSEPHPQRHPRRPRAGPAPSPPGAHLPANVASQGPRSCFSGGGIYTPPFRLQTRVGHFRGGLKAHAAPPSLTPAKGRRAPSGGARVLGFGGADWFPRGAGPRPTPWRRRARGEGPEGRPRPPQRLTGSQGAAVHDPPLPSDRDSPRDDGTRGGRRGPRQPPRPPAAVHPAQPPASPPLTPCRPPAAQSPEPRSSRAPPPPKRPHVPTPRPRRQKAPCGARRQPISAGSARGPAPAPPPAAGPPPAPHPRRRGPLGLRGLGRPRPLVPASRLGASSACGGPGPPVLARPTVLPAFS